MNAVAQKILEIPHVVIAITQYEKTFNSMKHDPVNAKTAARLVTAQYLLDHGFADTKPAMAVIEEHLGGLVETAETEPVMPVIEEPITPDADLRQAKALANPAALPDFVAIAKAAIARGETRILPIHVGGKNPIVKWAHEPTHNATPAEWTKLYADWLNKLAQQFPNANACTVARVDEFLYIDEDDSEAFRAGYETFAERPFPKSHTTSARPGRCQSGWIQTDYSRSKLWNITQGKTRDQMFSLRFNNMYVIAEGSVYKDNVNTYKAVDNSPLVPIPDKLVDYILSCLVDVSGERAHRDGVDDVGLGSSTGTGNWFDSFSLDEPFIHGNIDNQVKDLIWYYIKEKNISDGHELFELIEGHFEANGCYEADGETPFNWSREQIRAKCDAKVKSIKTRDEERADAAKEALAESDDIRAKAVSAYNEWLKQEQAAPQTQPNTLTMSASAAAQPTQPVIPQFLLDPDPTWPYAITPEEYEVQADLEYPVYPLKEGAGPAWDDSTMYGIAGDIVRKAAEYNEAHPSGMYLDLLVSLGNIIGRGPYFNVTSTQHHANEFLVRVGETAKARKGTGRDAINIILSMVDPVWYKDCVQSGFGSAEAIVYKIRDDSNQQMKVRGKNTFEIVSVPGVADKRLMIREAELASIFQLAGKKESRADVILRDGWDSNPLRNVVKGTTGGISNSALCMNPHMSISADTTREEFLQKLPSGADQNGFGNRFLYCFVRRTKMCPSGGPDINWSAELTALNEALRFAKDLAYVGMQKETHAIWNRMYSQIEGESENMGGLAASMTARGAAHVRRLALNLCLLDNHDAIETKHLYAAKRIWDYCEDSARYIFGGMTKDQTIIHGWVAKTGPVTLTRITQQLYKKNRKVEWVRNQVNGLVQADKLVVVGDQITAK